MPPYCHFPAATPGTRITVRVFVGWDFGSDEVERPDFAKQGYARGVPMGGDLTDAPSGTAPTFIVRALRDPDFDPCQRAFYYVRVIEIPTPRWTAYDAKLTHFSIVEVGQRVIEAILPLSGSSSMLF